MNSSTNSAIVYNPGTDHLIVEWEDHPGLTITIRQGAYQDDDALDGCEHWSQAQWDRYWANDKVQMLHITPEAIPALIATLQQVVDRG